MTLSQIKSYLSTQDTLLIHLPDGTCVPAHFHVTEVGEVRKNFIDCGGKLRRERVASFQLWNADDYDHRLHPEKLVHIIELAEKELGLGDLEIEVEFQGANSIEKYGLVAGPEGLRLTGKQTACLALEDCGLPQASKRVALNSFIAKKSSCTPGGGCC